MSAHSAFQPSFFDEDSFNLDDYDAMELEYDIDSLPFKDDLPFVARIVEEEEVFSSCCGKSKPEDNLPDHLTLGSSINHQNRFIRELYQEPYSHPAQSHHFGSSVFDDEGHFEDPFDFEEELQFLYELEQSTEDSPESAPMNEEAPLAATDSCSLPTSPDEEEKISTARTVPATKKRPFAGIWNNFTIRRACFRGLIKYFRERFARRNKQFQKKRSLKKKNLEMRDLVREFCVEEFGAALSSMGDQVVFLEEAVMALLNCHRYKKAESFLQDIDFSVVRDCMYRYTQDARERFMETPAYAFLFLHFCEHGAGALLLEKDQQTKEKKFVEELANELKLLQKEAWCSLKREPLLKC